ncbi:CPBP family intramembrane metalloprotease [Candidatus Poribacteria bacterium]|nr:CPBP family intramembrane metalloprotease [Candidatus Poribacteria bacterium]
MFFRIKHKWYLALLVVMVSLPISWKLGAWEHLTESASPLAQQIGIGILAGMLSLGIDGALHETFKRMLGQRYLNVFERHGRAVLGAMRWPAYIAGGLMAALTEEPLFRGVLLLSFDNRVLGIGMAAVVFAFCHWLRLEFLGFWFWAILEGLLFGILMVLTGSLLVPMIAHGIHDLVGYRVFQTLIREK